MYSHGESSNAAAQRGQGFNGGYGGDQYYLGKSLNATFHHGQRNNGHQFYPEESSNASAQRGQGFHDGGFGFVSQNQRHNGSGPSGGGFNQANIPPQFHSNRNNGNGQRYNSRPRFNGRNGFNFGYNNRGSGYGNSGGSFQNKGGSSWTNWNGNTSQKSAIIHECQICNKYGHIVPNCYYRNKQPPMIHGTISECQICGKRGHTALNCFHRSNYAYQGTNPPSTLTAMTA